MKPIYYLILLSLVFCSCSENPKKPVGKANVNEAQQQEKLNNLNLNFNNPIQIDSAEMVMYPLILNKEEDDLYSIKSGTKATTYWNVAFYNTADQTYHLLDDNRKMVIYEFDEKAPYITTMVKSDKKMIASTKGFIYYLARATDFNNNGNIDLDDPKYLFTSDKKGRNFRQISPENMSVQKWDVITATGKVLLTMLKDSNNDKKFNEKDDVVPMIYNLQTDSLATDVFPEDFNLMIKQALSKQWSTK